MSKNNLSFILFFTLVFTTLQSKSDFKWNGLFGSKGGVKTVENELYNEECGSCHFAYQPGLLPSRSWKKLMENKSLQNHFEEDISYDDKKILNELTNYLISNAADKSKYKRSIKINRSIPSSSTPIRISEAPYIKRKHHELSTKVIKQDAVGSLGNCTACHNSAQTGDYDDDNVTIPSVTAGYIYEELNSKPDGYEGFIKEINKSYKIISTKVRESYKSKKLCRVVSFKDEDTYQVRTFCKFKGGNWF